VRSLINWVTPKNFEQLAEEAGLAESMVKRRVPELAETRAHSIRAQDQKAHCLMANHPINLVPAVPRVQVGWIRGPTYIR
jgi:hypothetical protein